MRTKKPRAIQRGDRLAAVSLSRGGPSVIPVRYEAGKRQLEEEFGVTVVEMPHTLSDDDWLSRNPQARADDLMQALQDDSINGIVSTIGGDDSIRLLPYIDLDVITANPKVFVWYSDTTVTHLALLKAGVTTFLGPSVMSGFGESCGMHAYLVESFRRVVMTPEAAGVVPENRDGWTVEHNAWSEPGNQERRRKLSPPIPWRFIQGQGRHRGHLIGGCLEVMEWLRGTPVWPTREEWEGAILVLETSEEAPPPSSVTRALRSYAAEGILEHLSGVIMGRPGGGIDPARFTEYDSALQRVVRDEQGLSKMPLLTQMDFGHTDPMLTLPLGVQAEIDCDRCTFSLTEAAVGP
jgi:muramoyltetrapeptide carboxypeptidase LdcA involved in peptidoglycan recycling